MAAMGRAAQALALQQQGGQQSAYFNPPVTGAAKLAPGFQAPGPLTPMGGGRPALGQYL
jgi:hypothetical protein